VRLEGQDPGVAAEHLGLGDRLRDDLAVSTMNTVEKSNGCA
jgi:hypothetical protein